MKWPTLFLFIFVTTSSSTDKMKYKLHFPETCSGFAQLTSTLQIDLHEFTICYWLKINRLNRGSNTVLSYAVPSDDNEIRVFLEGHHKDSAIFGFDRKSQFRGKVRRGIELGAWYHVCNIWSSWSGNWAIYIDGLPEANGTGLAQSFPVTKGGVLILGQDQDVVGGGMASKDALIGELLDVNVWDEVLSSYSINDLSTCLPRVGNVVSWLNSPFALYGGTVITPTQLCDSLIPRVNPDCVVKKEEIKDEKWNRPCWGMVC